MSKLLLRVKASLRSDERGASLVEYALLLALVALVCVGALTFFGSETGNSADSSASCIEAAYAGKALPAGCG